MMKKVAFFGSSVIIATLVATGFSTSNINSEDNEKVAKGINTVTKLEKQDVSKIQDSIDNYLEKLNENKKENIPQGTKDYKEIFKDDVFFGDSQTEGLSAYGLLNENSVLAEKGKTVGKALNDVDTLKFLAPKRVYLLFGLNDLLNYNDISDFMKDYGKLIDKVQKELPKTKIYVQSVMPARSDVIAKQPLYSNERNITANKELQKLCKEKKVTFVDIKSILEKNQKLYEPDGLHVNVEFNKLWLNKIAEIKEKQ